MTRARPQKNTGTPETVKQRGIRDNKSPKLSSDFLTSVFPWPKFTRSQRARKPQGCSLQKFAFHSRKGWTAGWKVIEDGTQPPLTVFTSLALPLSANILNILVPLPHGPCKTQLSAFSTPGSKQGVWLQTSLTWNLCPQVSRSLCCLIMFPQSIHPPIV